MQGIRAAAARLPRPLWSARPPPAPGPAQRVPADLLAVAALGLFSLAAVLVLTLTGRVDAGPARIVLHVLVVGAPVATGLYAVRAHRNERFGRMLMVTGLVWSLAILGEAHSSLAYSAGRIVAWCIFPLLVYVMLAFPTGRLAPGRDRRLFVAVTTLIVVLFIGSALFSESYPSGSPWASCDADCPPNAFLVLDAEPAWVDTVVGPLRDTLAVLLLGLVTFVLAGRLRGGSPLQRATTTPVFVVSIAITVVLVAFIVVRRVVPDSDAVATVGLIWAFGLPALAAAFSVGLLQRRLLISRVLSDLSLGLQRAEDADQVRFALREAADGIVVDVRAADGGAPGDGGLVRGVHDETGPIAEIVFADGAAEDDDLTDAVVAMAEASLRKARLEDRLALSLSDLDDSRKRIATAADVERRRIERDLHDGAQQRLIALRMRLTLAEGLLKEDPAAGIDAVHDLGVDVDLALEEIRSLAHGIYPALLADRGLRDALRSVARRSPLPIDVRAIALGRHSPELESAVYYTCVEALQNVSKHAPGAEHVHVNLRQSSHALDFEVTDDGGGFDPARTDGGGVGLRSMHDRIESLGGELTIESAPGAGTRVSGTIPLARR